MVVRITVEKFLEYLFGLGLVFQIILIDLAHGEERIDAVAAAGVFAAQELVLADGRAQGLVIVKAPAHLRQQFGHGNHAGVCLGASRRTVVHAPVGGDHALVFVAALLRGGKIVQGLPHALCGGVLGARPGLGLAPCLQRQRREQQQEQGRTQTPCALASIGVLQFSSLLSPKPVVACS